MKKPTSKTKAKSATNAKSVAMKSADAAPAPKVVARAAASAHDPLHNLLRDRYARKICGTA